MTWDDAEEPQVEVPFDRFHNSWNLYDSAFTGYQLGASGESGTVTAYVFYAMPFLKKALGKIVHMDAAASSAAVVNVTLLYKVQELSTERRTNEEGDIEDDQEQEPDYLPGQFGYYHARWVFKPWEMCFNELLNLQDQTGHLVSHSWRLTASLIQWVENDPVVYIDDAQTPKLWFSGLEDEIGGAHGFKSARYEHHPFHGWQLDYIDEANPNNEVVAYKLGLGDKQCFMKNYVYGIQGHNQGSLDANLDYTFHWYASSQPSLWLTDEIDLGSDESMVTHSYEATPDVPFTEVSSAVNGQWFYYVSGWPEVLWIGTDLDCPADKEQWMSKRGTVMTEEGSQIHFKMAIDPRNEGVLLRRMLDLYHTPQRALVYVDEGYVNVWSYSDHGTEFAPLRFADNTDFLIPARFTAGKSSIQVKLIVERRPDNHHRIDNAISQGFGWSAFHYSVYSIVAVLPDL